MEVIVVGMGASGVAALRKLHEAGINAMGLEAADRIGGRIHTVPFGNGVVDIGAAWCHGEKNNLVYELASQHDLLGRPEPHELNCQIYNGFGRSIPEVMKIVKFLEDTIAAADKNNDRSISETVREAVNTAKHLSSNGELVNAIVEWYERNNHVGGQDDSLTGKSLKGLVEGWPCEGEFWLNWKGRGYRTILDVLLNKYPDASKQIPVNIQLYKEVETIEWQSTDEQGNPTVRVKCKDSSVYVARSVIVTMSVGVLKERHTKLFNPPLPQEKVNSISNLQLCVLGKIYVEFEKPWWPAKRTSFSIFWCQEDKAKFTESEKWVTEIHGAQTVEHEPNVLLVWIYGKGAEEMERATLDQVKAGVEKLFDTVVPEVHQASKISRIKSVLRSQWASDPLTRGAYSYRSVATEQSNASAISLSEPLSHQNHPTVCFAGEATSHHYHNSVHGAIEAGFREAGRLIQVLGKKNKK